MNTNQQYQLKIGVYHHPQLKTDQLIQFLKIQSNQFLRDELPQNLMIRQTFYSVFQIGSPNQVIDFDQFVGIIVIYSSSSRQSFQYAKKCLPVNQQLTGQQFFLFVEMDNSQKKLNVIGNQGQQQSKKLSLLFIRLTLKNPQDLVANLNRNLYLMIQNYYYPNQQQKNKQSGNLDIQINPSEFFLHYSQSQHAIIADQQQKNSNLTYNTQQKLKMFSMIDRAESSRKTRQIQMIAQQSAIDNSIQNVQKVLNNINRHIKQKLQSNWFSKVKNSLYKPIQKQSKNYNKIKLTQQFIDEVRPKSRKNIFKNKIKETLYRQNIFHSKYNSSLQQSFKKLDSALMKILISYDQMQNDKIIGHKIAQVQVFQSSTYQQLASNALKKLDIYANQNNTKNMIGYIKNKIQTYIRQLSKGIRIIQRQRTFQRSYLNVQKK